MSIYTRHKDFLYYMVEEGLMSHKDAYMHLLAAIDEDSVEYILRCLDIHLDRQGNLINEDEEEE